MLRHVHVNVADCLLFISISFPRSPSRYTDHDSSEEDCCSSRAKTKASNSNRDVEVIPKGQIARPVPPRPSVPSCIVSQPQLPPPENQDVNGNALFYVVDVSTMIDNLLHLT